MLDNKQYISILSTATGEYSVDVETFNASINVNFSVTTAGSAGDDEIDMAQRLETAFITVLSNTSAEVPVNGVEVTTPLLYAGTPIYSGDTPSPTFQVTRTGHVLCVWSQCQFRVQVTNTIGNEIVVLDVPLFSTLAELESMSAVRGVDLETADGTAMTTAQKVDVLKSASACMVTYLHNPIVMSTHLEEITGRITQGIRVHHRPIVAYNSPRMRYAILLWYVVSGTVYSVTGYDVNHSTGWIKFRHHSSLFSSREPFGMNNEVKVTYVAGYMDIPFIIKEKLVSLIGVYLGGEELGGDIQMLAGGTGRIQYSSGASDTIKFIIMQLSAYQL